MNMHTQKLIFSVCALDASSVLKTLLYAEYWLFVMSQIMLVGSLWKNDFQ